MIFFRGTPISGNLHIVAEPGFCDKAMRPLGPPLGHRSQIFILNGGKGGGYNNQLTLKNTHK